MKSFKGLIVIVMMLFVGSINTRGEAIEEVRTKYLNVLGIAPSEYESVNKMYTDTFSSFKEKNNVMEGYYKDHKVLIYKFTEKGYWDDITAIVAFDSNKNEVLGFEILSHKERRGAPAAKPRFKEQFVDLEIDGDFKVVQGGVESKGYTMIDGVSGATSTNNAIEKGLNKALKYFEMNKDF